MNGKYAGARSRTCAERERKIDAETRNGGSRESPPREREEEPGCHD